MTTAYIVPFEEDRRAELARWGVAAGVMLAAHVAVAAVLLLRPSEESAPADSPAMVIELAPIATSPEERPLDVAPGPEMVESQAAAKPVAPEPPAPFEPLPQAEAEAVLPPQTKEHQVAPPKDEQPQTERTNAPPAPEQRPPAPLTTAAPRPQSQQLAKTAAAPSSGAATVQPVVAPASWRDLVLAHLQHYKRYPGSAVARREQGLVYLSFTMDRNGRVLSRRIMRSSGVDALDQEVLAMIDRAQPLPRFLPSMPQDQLTLSVPIEFSLR
jgi:periplasmic protein TonB